MGDPFDVDPRLERMLSDARREEELRQRKALERNANRANFLENYQWIKYIIYIWAIRLSFTLLAGLIPMGMGFYRSFIDKPPTIQYTSELPQYTWRQLLKDDFSAFTNSSFRSQPSIIRYIPIISEESVHVLLESLGSKAQIPVKVSNHAHFSYFDSDRPWSEYFAEVKQYQNALHSEILKHTNCLYPFMRSLLKFQVENIDRIPSCVNNSSKEEDQSKTDTKHLYLAYPQMSRWLERFAPSLSLISSTLQTSPAQTNLWLSSPNVHAHMHYDIQDNFLLQLAGNDKNVIIVSPEALPIIRSYSSFHPLWRQSMLTEEELSPSALYHQRELSVTTPLSSLYNVSSFMIWEITLSPGDMLYIPAGFFHSVAVSDISSIPTPDSESNTDSAITEIQINEKNSNMLRNSNMLTESVSINNWYPSRVNDIFHRLQRVSLPFQPQDKVAVKVAKVMAIMTVLCQIWEAQNRDCLLDELAHRFLTSKKLSSKDSNQQELEEDECPKPAIIELEEALYAKTQHRPAPAHQQELCSETTLQVAEFNVQTTRTANEIAVIVERSKLPMPLQVLAILEFVEEILATIFSSTSLLSILESEQGDNHNVDENKSLKQPQQQLILDPCTMALLLKKCRTQKAHPNMHRPQHRSATASREEV